MFKKTDVDKSLGLGWLVFGLRGEGVGVTLITSSPRILHAVNS